MLRSEKIKVLHLIASRGIGGAERVLLTLSKNIDRKKFDLVIGIFTNQRNSDGLWKEAEKLDLPLELIRFKNAYDVRQILDTCRVVRKHHPHIIHTHGYKSNILGFFAAKLFRIPIMTTVHGLYQIGSKTSSAVQLSLLLLRHFTLVIPVSDQIRAELRGLKVPVEKMVTTRNIPPLNIETYSQTAYTFREEIDALPTSKIVGFVGRLEHVKGCDQLIRAVASIEKKNLDFCVVIVGDGPERTLLEALVEELDLRKKVHFCGFRYDPMRVFQSLDLLVLPSRNEGIPLAMLEAMSQGVPVVATRVGGIPEVIQDKVNGLLVEAANPRSLAEAIVECLSRPDETEKRVLEAKKTVTESYNLEAWIKKYQSVYDRVAQ